MNGEHILYCQDRGIIRRVDRLMSLYTYACAVFFAISVLASVVLIWLGSVTTAISMFILSTAITGYAYSSLLQRQQHIKEITDKTIDALQKRWDELRRDQELISFFAASIDQQDLNDKIKLKVRLFIATVLDMYALVLHYINHGYFIHAQHFAAIYENMIKSLFRYPHICEVWKSRDVWGKGCLRDEYGESLVYVVDEVIKEIEQEMNKEKTIP